MIIEFNILRSCLRLPWPFVIVDHLPKISMRQKTINVLRSFAYWLTWRLTLVISNTLHQNIITYILIFNCFKNSSHLTINWNVTKIIQHFYFQASKIHLWNHTYLRRRQVQVLKSCFWTNMIDTTEQILRSQAKKHEFDLSPTFFWSHNHHNKYSTKDVSFTCVSCSLYFCCVSFFFFVF